MRPDQPDQSDQSDQFETTTMTARLAVNRRVVLATLGWAEVAALLASCGGTDDPAQEPPAAGPLARVDEVPVGGGVILPEHKVVVTQPTGGDFRAFDSTCTHQFCQVTEVVDSMIKCPCHGSWYSIQDGSVQFGPAPSALPAVSIRVDGENIVRG